MTNTALLQNDARNRALRTFLQNLGFDVLAAVVLLLLPVFQNAQGWTDLDWALMGFTLTKTVVVTLFSYLMRTILDRSRIPTPLPPAPVPAPADPVGD